ncbi:L-asparaginase-like isoform X2 [Aedes albopictus]|uniref:asparaginase n=1 Tax=Aedes albopictus TaxID=7160 RepID=A0ABM1YLQ7_AEDAL
MAQQRQSPAEVLVLHTGGTIGMIHNENDALSPKSGDFIGRISRNPNLHDSAYPEQAGDSATTFTLPYVKDQHRRIRYQILESEPLLDSSNMNISNWVQIAGKIKEHYQRFDGFVVLHGTDTLVYTASALSFLFENLQKTVVVTGAQIPICNPRTDGHQNFVTALIIAGTKTIPEVCVYFNNQLFRGNRTTKRSNSSMDAFWSPNAEPLGKVGVGITTNARAIFRTVGEGSFDVNEKMDANVDLLHLHPFISKDTVEAILGSNKGVVLLSYGAGNIPTNREDLREALEKAARKKLIVNCTQCQEGTVCGTYETGRELEEIGVISGCDMTVEAALVKLAYVLGNDKWNFQEKKEKIKSNLRGELTASESD